MVSTTSNLIISEKFYKVSGFHGANLQYIALILKLGKVSQFGGTFSPKLTLKLAEPRSIYKNWDVFHCGPHLIFFLQYLKVIVLMPSSVQCVTYQLKNFQKRAKWAASWQNQQNGMCAQRRLRSAWASTQSDQRKMKKSDEESLAPKLPTECTAKTLMKLGRCQGWSESSQGAQLFCWFRHEAAQKYWTRKLLMVISYVNKTQKCWVFAQVFFLCIKLQYWLSVITWPSKIGRMFLYFRILRIMPTPHKE